jgi:glyoxylase-like metal-dependent hydrolase (beta-lactamase superfamily II)
MSELEDLSFGGTTILFGRDRGKYPDANCVLVEGADERVLLDTTPGLVERGREAIGTIDRILLTHAHEDHLAGNFLFPDAAVQCHQADLSGLHSLEGFVEIFGPTAERRSDLEKMLVERFHYVPRPDATGFEGGHVFDLGGGVSIEVVHSPGHTRGHCAFWIRPADILVLGDVDLSSFGPFYADAWGSLEDFEETLRRLRPLEASYYLTGHHIGLLEGRGAFLERLDRYEDKVRERESLLLEFLAQPRTIDEVVAHRFVYRPQDDQPGIDHVERRSMSQHIERLMREGRVVEAEEHRLVAPGSQ